jgi:pimeloyl-ACP methyl ester carboxylesterase
LKENNAMPGDADIGYANINGTRLFYEIAGAGEPLVLVHGFGLDRRMWDGQFADFAQHRRVARYDLRGFGRSAPPEVGHGYRHVDDLKALLDHLDIDRAALVGLSLGGLIALNAALEYPDRVSALVLVDAIISGWPMSAEWDEEFGQVRREAHSRGVDVGRQGWLNISMFAPTHEHPEASPLLRQMISDWSTWQFANRDPENTSIQAVERLGEVRAPTLVVVGERDQPDFHAVANELALGIPLARKVVVPGAGHMVPMEAPAEFNTLVIAYLQESAS